MKIYNKFVESKKEPYNKNDIWFDGSSWNMYKEGAWRPFTISLQQAKELEDFPFEKGNFKNSVALKGGENNLTSENEVAFGIYNKSNSDTCFSVGIGTSAIRKNAIEIKKNGDIYITGVNGKIQDRINNSGGGGGGSYYDDTELRNLINTKVDKIEGKHLSTEDFTTELKNKLLGLYNYNDAVVLRYINDLRGDFDTLVSGDTKATIDNFNEITAFLENVSDTQTLNGIIAGIEQQIAGKMDKVTLANVATSGSYNDLSNKPTIPTATTVANWGFTKNTGTYSKPSGGIPKTDLASAVRTSLEKADTALQSYTEQYTGTITGVSANGMPVASSGEANIPAASKTKYGVTMLTSATSSDSETLAATPKAVKKAYDLANSKASMEDVNTAIANAITNVLNTEV